MLLQRRGRSRWLLLGMLLCRMLVSMVMVMDVERKRNSRVHVLVREMVLHRGKPQGVVEQVMVMVVVMGPKRRERHWHEAWGTSGTGARPAPPALVSPPPALPAVARAAHPPAVQSYLADAGVVG